MDNGDVSQFNVYLVIDNAACYTAGATSERMLTVEAVSFGDAELKAVERLPYLFKAGWRIDRIGVCPE